MPLIPLGSELAWFVYSPELRPGISLFICAHGGWDGHTYTAVPDRARMFFWNYHGKSITDDVCYQIMKGNNTRNIGLNGKGYDPRSIAGPGAPIWDYDLTEFPGDWDGAIQAVTEANKRPIKESQSYDCVMIQAGPGVKLSRVFDRIPGYREYHLMACRVEPAHEGGKLDVRKV